MRATRWMAAHWPGAQEPPGLVEDPGGEPAGTVPVVEVDASSSGAAVGRWITAPFRWIFASLRTAFAWAVEHWPGSEELPPVYGPPVPAAVAAASSEPGEPQPLAGAVEVDEQVEVKIDGRQRERRPRKVPLFGLRQIGTVFHAVYAALADPIARADHETRERRAAQARKAGLAAASMVLAVLLVYSIFPVRAFLHQWNATDRQRDRLDVLTEQNEVLDERVKRLQTEEEIERLAREQHGLVYPGEEPVILLPAPEE